MTNQMKIQSIVFAAVFFTFSCSNEKAVNVSTEINEPEVSVLSTPIKNIKVENKIYNINSEKDTLLIYKTGSKIVVPKNAFVDKYGHTITGPVKLTYREFTNPVDIFLAGIPMVYDSAGIEQVFVTAGMLELNAYSQGQPVFPNPENKIQVQMNSFQRGNEFSVYQLDTISGKWNYIGEDKVEIEEYNETITSLPQLPAEPKKVTPFSFSIGDDTGNHPEISLYENVLFEPIDNKYCGFNSTDIKVNDLGNGIYEVIFILEGYGYRKEQSCKCYLAFNEGVEYDNAMKVYQNKYKGLIQKREKMKQAIEQEWKQYFDLKQDYLDVVLEQYYQKELKQLSGDEKITRTLEVSGFGFINLDEPCAYPQGAELVANFKDKQGNDLELSNVVLVEKGRNALFRYTSVIKFDPQKENILWGITKDDKFVYMKADDFRSISATTGEYTFAMTVHPEKLNTYNDIINALFR